MTAQPDDERAFLGAGLAFPLRLDERGRLEMSRLDDHVRQSIGLILETGKGERVLRPDFGAGLHELVFAPLDAATLTLVGHQVREALVRFEPRIDVEDVQARADDEQPGRLVIHLRYRVRRTDTMFNLVYPFYLARSGL